MLTSQTIIAKSGPIKVGKNVENYDVRAMHLRELDISCLVGDYCCLSPLNTEHAQDLYNAYSLDASDEAWNYMSYGPWSCVEEYIGWIQNMQATKHDECMYAVIDKQSGKPLGVCSYLRINCVSSKSIEVGHLVFSKLMQRSIVSSECLIMMIRNAFLALGYRRVEWKCNVQNTKSIRSAQRLGFTFEGVHRNAIINKGRNRDTAWLSIIEEEFEELNGIYTHWLTECNSAGQQSKSLSNLTETFPKQRFPHLSIYI